MLFIGRRYVASLPPRVRDFRDDIANKDTNRKIRKCIVHRLYTRFFSSTDIYKL